MSTISIGFKLVNEGDGFHRLTMEAQEFRGVIGTISDEFKRLGSKFIDTAAFVTVMEGMSSGMQQLKSVTDGLVAANSAQVEAETKLANNMRNTMNAREADIESIKDLCSAQQELGVIGDEVQLAGAQELATYLSEKDALAALIPVMNDMLAQQYGLNASQESAAQIATMLGKVMDGQTGALSRYGYSFDKAQEAILKNGDEMQRVAVLAQVVESSVGGMNAALAQTPEGKLQQTKNALGDMKEQLGAIVMKAAPFVEMLASFTLAAAGILKAGTAIKAVTVATIAFTRAQKANAAAMLAGGKAAATLTRMLALLTTGQFRAVASMKAFRVALAGLVATTVVGAVIMGLVEALQYFTKSANDAADAADGAADSIKRLLDEKQRLKDFEESDTKIGTAGDNAAGNARIALEMYADRLKDFKGSKADETKLVRELNDLYGEEMGYFKDAAGWYKALTANSKTYCEQMRRQARIEALLSENEKLQEDYNDIRGPEGNRRKYSTGTPMKTVSVYDKDNDTFRSELRVAGPSQLEKANAALSDIANRRAANEAEVKRLQKENDASSYSVTGSSVRPDSAAGIEGAKEAKKTAMQKVDEAITKATEAYISAEEGERDAIRATIAALNDKKAAIERLVQESSLPAELSTIEDVDKAIAYQQTLRKRATADNIAAIDLEIERLGKLRDSIDESGFVAMDNGSISTYEELEQQLAHYNKALRTATEQERAAIQQRINSIEDLKEEWDNVLAALKMPADIGALETLGDLSEAISYYSARLQRASGGETESIQRTIRALEKKKNALESYASALDRLEEAGRINALEGREYRIKVQGIGFDSLMDQIAGIDRELSNPDIGRGHRKALEELRGSYATWAKECATGFDTYRAGWESIKGIGSGVEGITDALSEDANAWERITGIVDGFLQIYDGVAKIVEIINMLTAATRLQGMAKQQETAETVAGTSATIADTAATEANTVAKGGEAIAGAAASGSSMPFPANLAAIAAGLALVMGILAMTGCFATGGIVGGTSRTGDKMLARVNSGEMILNARQQKRLFDILNGTATLAAAPRVVEVPEPQADTASIAGIAAQINITGRLTGRGSELVAVLANETRLGAISGRRSHIQS